MKTEKEIIEAIQKVAYNSNLTFGYRYDVKEILNWVLGQQDSFDGLDGS